jgi:5'-nucleotidase
VLVTRGYMARGKDGFTSLLVKSEGGEAEEIVSEENGILISMMLRQYFMSLKIVGQWKMWGKSMDRHWQGVQKSMSATQLPTLEQKEPKVRSIEQVAGSIFASQPKKEIPATATSEDPLDEEDEDINAD